MKDGSSLGTSPVRADALDKVSGTQRYTGDLHIPGMLHSALVTSPHAHARIINIDKKRALEQPGVRGVITGKDIPIRLGLYLGDKYPLALGVVRYFGEPVAAVVADREDQALAAARLVQVEYEELPVVRSPLEALQADAPLLHPDMAEYRHISAILPEPGTNVANRTRIRKGDVHQGFAESAVIIEEEFRFPPGDHAAMEVRVAIAEIGRNGVVTLYSATQAPFVVRSLMSTFFNIPAGKIRIIALPVGGGFGGKAGIQLEGLAYLLSRALGGRPVMVRNQREEDMLSSPGHIGLFARLKAGARSDGTLSAMELEFLFDSGAYADYAVNISRAAAIACTGPYRVPHVKTDSLCVYTNHPFATAYRGFGHIELAFPVERAMDLLARKLGMDPAVFRKINAIQRGDTSPTLQIMDPNTGDLRGCIDHVAASLNWSEGDRIEVSEHLVRAKGLGCLWKAPAMPTNTDAGAIITFNEDGSLNLTTGVVEIGQGTNTGLAQIVAERFHIEVEQVHVLYEVHTDRSPHDWATAASRSLFMAGRAALEAADDAIHQIKQTASIPLACPPEDLEVAGGRVFLRDNPSVGLSVAEVALGYQYPKGTSIGGQVIGRGRYIARHLTGLDPETGRGEPALEWTLGAEGVEVEVNLRDGSYRVLKAACTMDVGRVVHPALARGQIVGALAMALGFASREGFQFDERERAVNGNLRDFKLFRYGDEPEYLVDFLETPQGDGPYGLRGLGEQGVIGVPAALANALSRAIGVELNELPLTPERVWRALQTRKTQKGVTL